MVVLDKAWLGSNFEFGRLTVSALSWLPTLTINRAGKNRRTATFEICLEASALMSWNCEEITPTKMVKRTATDACRAPKKGISNSWVASPIVMKERQSKGV